MSIDNHDNLHYFTSFFGEILLSAGTKSQSARDEIPTCRRWRAFRGQAPRDRIALGALRARCRARPGWRRSSGRDSGTLARSVCRTRRRSSTRSSETRRVLGPPPRTARSASGLERRASPRSPSGCRASHLPSPVPTPTPRRTWRGAPTTSPSTPRTLRTSCTA